MKKGIGLRHAFRGFFLALKSEINMKIHVTAVIVTVIAGIARHIELWAWASVLICFGLVIALEMVNSALERLCDRVTGENEPIIRDIKDIAAGAVLVCCVISVAVAVVVFVIA